MRRIPFLLALMVSALAVMSGSALAAVARTVASPPANTSLPTISGTAREVDLTAAGAQGGAAITAYQWRRCNSLREQLRADQQATVRTTSSRTDANNTIHRGGSDGRKRTTSLSAPRCVAPLAARARRLQPDPSGRAESDVKVDSGGPGPQADHVHLSVAGCTAVNPVCSLASVTG